MDNNLIKGKDLNPEQKALVLASFPYRWTSDNDRRVYSWGECDKCDIRNPYVNTESAEGHKHPTLPLTTDAEWLNNYAFYFKQNGKELGVKSYCEPQYYYNVLTGANNETLDSGR